MIDRSDPFSGIRLKRARAWDEINRIEADITTYLSGDPYTPKVKFDTDTSELIVSVHVGAAPDQVLGVRVGEVIHNLRSALDHAIWELVVLNTKSPPPENNKNQFPIFKTKAGFEARGIPQNLAGVSLKAVQLIESEQPFPASDGGTGEEFSQSPLWHLRELSNHDKHRTLHMAGAMLNRFKFETGPLKFAVKTFSREKSELGPIHKNAILERTLFLHSPSGKPVKEWPFRTPELKGHLLVDVAFDERTPTVGGWLVFGTLVDVANRTDRVLKRVATELFKIEL